jgi:D-arabinose 1-dehydrogenase-like Zn-dependent alcohol dehydrogenase
VVKDGFVLRIPDSIALDKAAPLLCAGITTFSPLQHWNVGEATHIAVAGIGGLGHVDVQLAKTLGATVTRADDQPRQGRRRGPVRHRPIHLLVMLAALCSCPCPARHITLSE